MDAGLPLLEEKYGNLLLTIDGASVKEEELDTIDFLLSEKGEGESFELVFMKPGDVLFNNPRIVVMLGLVEILKAMVEKGVVHATRTFGERKYPLLWNTYFDSADQSCFSYMLSLEDVDCNQRWGGRILLHSASNAVFLPLGFGAYKALANHSTTDANGQEERRDYALNSAGPHICNGFSALHFVLDRCRFRHNDGSVLVNQIKALLDGGASPLVRSNRHGTAMEFFLPVRNEEQTTRWEPRMFEEHFDVIEAMMREALL